MTFDVSDIAGPLFELVRTIEFDVSIGDAAVPIRVELFQAMNDETRFRARVWQREEVPQPDAEEASESESSVPEVLAERAVDLGEEYLDFEAEDSDAALYAILEDLASRLMPWTAGEKA